MMPDSVAPFIAARDLLLRLRTDYGAAVREFRWPVMDRFNWALDYFDHLPADDLALWCVGETEEKLSFGALRARSNQVANHLRQLGVRRGDRVMLLMPNIRQLWEALLALMKLGAVINPATTMLTEADLRDRFERGRIRHAIVDASLTGRFGRLPGQYTRIAVGGATGWYRFEDAYHAAEEFAPDGETLATDPLVLYFTSGTTSKPKLVLHSHQSYPVGQLSMTYVSGLRPADVFCFVASPGWAAHMYSLFGAWNAAASIVALAYPQFDAKAVLDALVHCGVTSFGAPPTVWRILVQEDLAAWPVRLREAISGGEPLNPEVMDHVQRVWGLAVRDIYGQTETACVIGNSPGQAITPGSMGWPMPGFVVKVLGENDTETDEGELAVALDRGTLSPHRRSGGTRAGRAAHIRRSRGRCLQVLRLPHQPLRD